VPVVKAEEQISPQRRKRAQEYKSEIEEIVRFMYQNPTETEFIDLSKLSTEIKEVTAVFGNQEIFYMILRVVKEFIQVKKFNEGTKKRPV
jgi:hypothetical protein